MKIKLTLIIGACLCFSTGYAQNSAEQGRAEDLNNPDQYRTKSVAPTIERSMDVGNDNQQDQTIATHEKGNTGKNKTSNASYSTEMEKGSSAKQSAIKPD